MAEETGLAELKKTATLVQTYGKRLVGDKRAQQFAAHISLMAQENPKIKDAKPESVLAAMMACVHSDMMPNTPSQDAFIIPYGDRVQFQIGYKGLVKLAYRSAQVVNINAELVFPEDHFKVKLGTDRTLEHEPSEKPIDRTLLAKATHVYATAEMKNGSTVFEVMSMTEIDKVKEFVKAKTGDVPWNKWPEAMAKKTVVKRMLKLLPSDNEDNRLQYAAAYDSWSEAGRLSVKDGELVRNDPKPVDKKKEITKVLDARKKVTDTEAKPVEVK